MDNESYIYHFGINGTLTEAGRKRQAKGVKKQTKIRSRQSELTKDTESQKENILDRKLVTQRYLTNWGRRRGQDRSFNLNARIKELESLDLDTIASIARLASKIDTNKTKYNELEKRYERIGRRYLVGA